MKSIAWWRPRPPPEAAGAVGIVLQATGSHAWAVSGGWGRAAERLGVLGAVLAPRAAWGARAPEDDAGLSEHLARSRPEDLILLLGFDWHSQALHRTTGWRRRVARARGRKLLYVQESIEASRRQSGSDAMAQAFSSAVELCDGVLHADLADGPIVRASGKPARWMPFGVDPELFRPEVPYLARAPRAFFRGKVDPFGDEREYGERRRLLGFLRERDLVEVMPYTPGHVTPEVLVRDFNRYRIAVNLPSVFAGHATRILEGMACGCCVVTNRTGVAELDALFRDRAEVLYYSNEAELEERVRWLLAAPAEAAATAARGRAAAMGRFALARQLAEVLAWAQQLFPGVLPGWSAPRAERGSA